MPLSGSAGRNRLLVASTPGDLGLLTPFFSLVDLPLKHVLELPGQAIDRIYFFLSGMASVIAVRAPRRIEVGIIGREGMSGLSVVLGDDRSVHETFMQGAGEALEIRAEDLRSAMQASKTLRSSLLRFVNVFCVQTAYTAAANNGALLEARLARWLLMAHDRVDRSDLPITHEFLSLMLGVRRSGVTTALHALEGLNLIKATRGLIRIVDRTGLIEQTAGFYGVPEAEYDRLITNAVTTVHSTPLAA